MKCYKCNQELRERIDSLLKSIAELDRSMHKGLDIEEKKRIRRSIFIIESKINELDPNWKRFNKYKT